MPLSSPRAHKLAQLVLFAVVFTSVEASPSTPASELPNLLFARDLSDLCSIELWHPQRSKSQLLTITDSCPEDLFSIGTSILFKERNTIREISLDDDGSEAGTFELPNLDFEVLRGKLSIKPDEDYLLLAKNTKLDVIKIGRLGDGRIGMHTRLEMFTDDSFNYLFILTAGVWDVSDELRCDRPRQICAFAELQSRSSKSDQWQQNRRIWHQAIRNNSHFAKEDMFSSPGNTVPVFGTELVFRVDNSQTSLLFTTIMDMDTAQVHANGATLILDEGTNKKLCPEKCTTNLVDRFILIDKMQSAPLELWDLYTGESVFGPLVHASWIDK